MVKFFILVLTWSEYLCRVNLSTPNQNLVTSEATSKPTPSIGVAGNPAGQALAGPIFQLLQYIILL